MAGYALQQMGFETLIRRKHSTSMITKFGGSDASLKSFVLVISIASLIILRPRPK